MRGCEAPVSGHAAIGASRPDARHHSLPPERRATSRHPMGADDGALDRIVGTDRAHRERSFP